MRILRPKKLYLPAVTIVTVVLLLLALMSILTHRNLDREKKAAMRSLHSQGLALIRSLEAGTRTGMMMPLWGEDAVATLLQETAKDESIAYIYLVDPTGKTIHSSDAAHRDNRLDRHLDLSGATEIAERIVESGSGRAVYELTKRFDPLGASGGMPTHRMMMDTHTHRGDILVLGLKMAEIEEARRSDIEHALIMAASLVILGSGAIFFVFVIQNYYLVDRTLKQTQDYTRQVVASMANGLLSIDTDGKITSYNLLALELIGLKEKGIKGTDLKTLVDFETSGIRKTLQNCETVLEREIAYRRVDGSTVPLAISVTPIISQEGVCQGAVIVLRNLSEIKRLEEKVRRAEKLAAIGELAAGVAHEIRNPLSSIRGFAQYLKHALRERPQEKIYAETMVSEVDRINKVITDLLSFARPMKLETAAVDIAELVRHSKRLVEADAALREVVIDEHLGGNLKGIRVDANQLKQALLNLLLNALQAVSAHGRIDIGAAVDAARGELRLWVEDDGPGIAPEEIEKIFEPFFSKRKRGTGLGLSIVHKIVENHGGDIRLESPVPGTGRGCRFTLLLPIAGSARDGIKQRGNVSTV